MKANLKSLRNQGYTLSESLAELVDNSIKAKAKNIELYLWFGNDPFILTMDDGYGMEENEIVNKALIVPDDNSNYTDSGPDDLGRYGLGLKQGTFAHCKSLTIFSKKENFSHKTQHIDENNPSDDLPNCIINEIVKSKIQELKQRKSGTIILWSDLDYLMKRRDSTTSNFYDQVERVKKHFKMIYHNRISKGSLNIYFQGVDDINKIKSYDPFYENSKDTIKLEDVPIHSKGSLITLKPYIIPKEISSEHLNKNGNELQGLYFSRKNRIIDFGGWFEIDSGSTTKLSTTDKFRRLRILTELPTDNVEDWIPSQKNKVNIPDFFKKTMFQNIKKIREKYLEKIREE